MNCRWPLNDSHFTLADRLRIAGFILNPRNRWTQGERVLEYERKWAEFVGVKYACLVSSGSAANTLLAQYVRDRTHKTEIIVPAVTWQTSVSPWIRAGFKPRFIDIDPRTLCLNAELLDRSLCQSSRNVAAVFPTTLLGFTPRIDHYQLVCKAHGVPLLLDNCESLFGELDGRNVSSLATSTTSLYFGHQSTTGTEGGVIFTNSEEEFAYFLLARNHGLTRSLGPYKDWLAGVAPTAFDNPLVHPAFDFAVLGSNFRSSDLAAYMGLQEMRRLEWGRSRRRRLYRYFLAESPDCLSLPTEDDPRVTHVPFALPIIYPPGRQQSREAALLICRSMGIETRPIVGGNLLRQRCYQEYGRYRDFPRAEHVHECGFYVGLNPSVTEEMLDELVRRLPV